MEINNWLLELGGVEKGYFRRNHYASHQEAYEEGLLENYVERLNHTDVYRTIYSYENDDIGTCNVIAPLCFDLDKELESDNDFNQVMRDTLLVIAYLEEELFISREMIQVYFSGSKGFHVLVPFEATGLEPSQDLPEKYKIIANKVNRETIYKTVDMKIYERRRLFRIENTINSKTGLYKVQIPMDMLYGLTYEDMRSYASEPKSLNIQETTFEPKTKKAIERILLINKMSVMKKRHPKNIISVERQDLLPCVKSLLEEGIGKGGRNNTCVAIASSLAQSGVDKDEAIEILLSWNDLNDPPMPQAEVVRTVNSAFLMAQDGRGYGCAFFKDNGHCIGDECKLY